MSPKSNWSFLIDENASRTLADSLRIAGYPAEHVCDAGLKGHPDSDVFAYAQAHQQTIITIDLDFSNITRYPPPHCGIIILRLANNTSIADMLHELQNGLNTFGEQALTGVLLVVEKGRIRVRR